MYPIGQSESTRGNPDLAIFIAKIGPLFEKSGRIGPIRPHSGLIIVKHI